MTSALVAFGQAVRKARLARLWTLELLAHEALGNQERKSYVSAVERGRKALSPLTVQKFAKALDLPEAVVDPLMFAAPAQDEAATPAEENADRLFDELDALRRHLKVSEDQAIALAVEYAKGNPTDLAGALRELQRALEVAAQRTPGSNLDADVAAIMAEVDRLNAAGEMAEAGRALQDALERRRERIAEERAAMVALLDKGIAQAVLERSVPDAVAREVEKLGIEVPDPTLRFEALRAVWQDWHVRGSDRGLNFDLAVSIALARASHSLARDADQRGAALNDLGVALATLGEREAGSDRLLQAVTAYQAALQEVTRDRAPLEWARTQNNLGNALRILGARQTSTERLLQAVAAFEAALQERTRDRVPLLWAMTQMNLGIALQNLGERETGTDRLLQAVAAYQAALQERTRDRAPQEWARTQMNMGTALASLGARETGADRLLQAVAAYQAALQEWTRDHVPLDWAATQMNLGTALAIIGERETGTDRLLQAVAAYQAALKEYTRDRVPQHWASTQNNLGNTLRVLGERETGTERLLQAVDAFESALREWTLDRVPLDWAGAQMNLGISFLALHDRTTDPADLARARDHALAARRVYGLADTRAEPELAMTNRLQATIARRGGLPAPPP